MYIKLLICLWWCVGWFCSDSFLLKILFRDGKTRDIYPITVGINVDEYEQQVVETYVLFPNNKKMLLDVNKSLTNIHKNNNLVRFLDYTMPFQKDWLIKYKKNLDNLQDNFTLYDDNSDSFLLNNNNFSSEIMFL